MSLQLLSQPSTSLHPLYSDNDSDMDNMLTVPKPNRKYRNPRSRMRMQRRSRRARARPAKRNTLPLFTPEIVSTPPPRPRTQSLIIRKAKTHKKTITQSPPQNGVKQQKRRIRTFYSKKWGNRLFGLSTDHCHKFPQNPVPRMNNNSQSMSAWHAQLSQRTAFDPEDDLRSLRSPSPTVSAVMGHLNVTDLNYDSSVSNIAANTDYEGYHEEDDDEHNHSRTRTINHAQSPKVTQMQNMRKLKIIVSAPELHSDERQLQQHREHMNNIKRIRRRYIPSDTEDDSCLSDAFSSSEDLTDADDEDANHGMFNQSSLFLSGNSKSYGVYSCFPYSDQSDTDYLSAQSGDFDELTICYHNNNDRNIPFRNRQMMMMNSPQYLSDLGPSDIGSSDTDYLSDSLPPPLN